MKTILMCTENPEGLKLEDVLEQLQSEVTAKVNKIIGNESPQSQLVVRNNLAIIEHLGAALALQKASYGVLNAMAPNNGPTGKPRI